MDSNQEMGLMWAVTALRNALLIQGVLVQEDIDLAVGEIFTKMALDKTFGAHPELLKSFDVSKVEHVVRTILHPAYQQEGS